MRYECVAQATTALSDRTHPMGAGVLTVSWWAPEGSEWRPSVLLPASDELHIVLGPAEDVDPDELARQWGRDELVGFKQAP